MTNEITEIVLNDLKMTDEREKFIEKYLSKISIKDIPKGLCHGCGTQRCFCFTIDLKICYLKKIYNERRLKKAV